MKLASPQHYIYLQLLPLLLLLQTTIWCVIQSMQVSMAAWQTFGLDRGNPRWMNVCVCVLGRLGFRYKFCRHLRGRFLCFLFSYRWCGVGRSSSLGKWWYILLYSQLLQSIFRSFIADMYWRFIYDVNNSLANEESIFRSINHRVVLVIEEWHWFSWTRASLWRHCWGPVWRW